MSGQLLTNSYLPTNTMRCWYRRKDYETRDVTFTYSVDDGNGGTDTATVTVTVSGTNDAPVATDSSVSGVAEDGAAQNFAYSATDVDGDSL